QVRRLADPEQPYLILLTAKGKREDVVAGLRGGADDYLSKPFDPEELQARLQAGRRIVELQQGLAGRVRQLEQALARVKQLEGLLPICCYCKRVRDEDDYWEQVEAYVAARTSATFSHGICPRCYEGIVKPQLEAYCQAREQA